MIAQAGNAFLWLAVIAATLLVFAALVRAEPRWVRASVAVMAIALVSCLAALVAAFLTDTLDLGYVRAHSSATQPLVYKIAAVWAGQEGSLLLWATLCGLVTMSVAYSRNAQGRSIGLPTMAGLAMVTGSLAIIVALAANPFTLSTRVFAGDGHGLDPLLRHWAMVVHPPIVLAGLAACLAPAMIILGGLWSGRNLALDPQVRRWAIAAWMLLGLGIVIGARWAYVEIGWGGYWNWDPVENASLLPWLFCTALVHTFRLPTSAAKGQWSTGLAIAAMISVLLGSWVTRSGAIPSVHAFAVSNVGWWLGAVLGSVLLFAAACTLRGRRLLGNQGAAVLHHTSAGKAITVANVLLVWMAGTVVVGMLTPLVSRGLGRGEIGVTHTFYMRLFVPAAVGCIVLMMVAPFLTPSAASERLPAIRNARRLGVLVAHVGVLIMAIGVAGSTLLAERTSGSLALGESLVIGERSFVFRGVSQRRTQDGSIVAADVGLECGGQTISLSPEQFFSAKDARPNTEVAIRSELWADSYVALVGWEPGGARVALEVRVLPLVSFIWWGCGLAALGVTVAMASPRRAVETLVAHQQQTTRQAGENEYLEHTAPFKGTHVGVAP